MSVFVVSGFSLKYQLILGNFPDFQMDVNATFLSLYAAVFIFIPYSYNILHFQMVNISRQKLHLAKFELFRVQVQHLVYNKSQCLLN